MKPFKTLFYTIIIAICALLAAGPALANNAVAITNVRVFTGQGLSELSTVVI